MIKDVLVVGGGIAGIQASLDLADMGIKVHMVEKLPASAAKWLSWIKRFPPTIVPSESSRPRCWMSVDIPI